MTDFSEDLKGCYLTDGPFNIVSTSADSIELSSIILLTASALIS